MSILKLSIRSRMSLAVVIASLGLMASLMLAGSVMADPGIETFESSITNQDGTPALQAGAHPYEVSTYIRFATSHVDPEGKTDPEGAVKDIHVELPPGFVGNPEATPKCPPEVLNNAVLHCPPESQVGVARITFTSGFDEHPEVFNMVPPGKIPAMFGFRVLGQQIYAFVTVRTNGDYGLTFRLDDISQALGLVGTGLTFWGVPADPGHDGERFPCNYEGGSCPSPSAPMPFLTNPTYCTGPLKTVLHADFWEQPGNYTEKEYVTQDSGGNPAGIEGCDKLNFAPTITAAPDTSQADSPAGLTVDVKVPQEGLVNPKGRSTADIQKATVTLPEGVAINPGQASGLAACQTSEDGVGTEGPPSCPAASKVGTVAITTPLLSSKLEGTVYVLQSNPPDLKLLVAASADGVNLKLLGDVHLDQGTGRLTTTFENTPQLPFTDLKLSFSGGAQAALTTPPRCGVYETTSDFTATSAPQTPDAYPTSSFGIDRGPGGAACVSSLPFGPSLTAGSTTDQAGGFTSFSLLLSRADGQQRVSSLQFKTPKGLLGMIRTVPLCSEAQAAAGACPASSQVGHTVVGAGPGPYPLFVPQTEGPAAPIYLTGPYKGAPYGLLIAVPVVAGPFDLGTAVVRAQIAVDSTTSQLTVTTDPLPSILDGVPTDIRTINAVIDRAGFMFNPTSCAPQSFSGTATSTEGATAAISTPFGVGSCQSLKFKPDFQVSTSGKTSRAKGASLDAKIVYPTVPVTHNQASRQANIAKVKIDLPKQLPSRLTTLQKACLAATFEANPGSCPAASVVGTATAVTPVLGVPLSGPAYFVSHGGEAFPSLVVVLQGGGVTIDLTGSTFISKAGITSSTFKQVPDVPITSFELKLPQGPHSALAANGNLCTSKLVMPTAFVGQNGAEIHESTKITATGCSKAKKKVKKPGKKTKTKKARANTKTRKTRK
jgi:hypothetical protein